MTAGDWAYLVAWFGGAFWFGWFVLVPFGLRFFSCQVKEAEVGKIKNITIYVMAVGGITACISAGFTAGFAGDPSGFWNLWVQDKAQVIKSLFTW
jgi:hypothetical protein